jgi:hypothetical protein
MVLAKFGPHPPKLLRAGELWNRYLRPFVFAAVAATFIGQALAFFYQLKTGEKDYEQ